MKSETVLLQGLFGACLLACALFLTGIVTAQPSATQLSAAKAPVVVAHTLG